MELYKPASVNLGDELGEKYDTLVLVSDEKFEKAVNCPGLGKYVQQLVDYVNEDKSFLKEPNLILLPKNEPIRKLIHSSIGPGNRDFDDVRIFNEAVLKGIKRAISSGSKKIAVTLLVNSDEFKPVYPEFSLVSVLGGLEASYVPLEIREQVPERKKKLDSIDFVRLKGGNDTLDLARNIELGLGIARDIGGSDPERMSPPNVAKYVQETFKNTCIKVEIMDDRVKIDKEFPCLGRVNRGSPPNHSSRVIFLTYEPEDGKVEKTIVLVGKGVCYDTGGHDIKAGGVMAGMHRDKCGSAAVAGYFGVLSQLKPKGIRVLGAMAMVRNCVGPDAYVSDELVTSRAGVRVRVGNTDAEGRMAMVDVLCYLKEKVLKENSPNPHLYTIATLTGHAVLAFGQGYTGIVENGVARKEKLGLKLKDSGEQMGEPIDISSLRREDYDQNKGKSEYEDVLQAGNLPSSRMQRGHQIPAAFLVMTSGLDKHGIDSAKPLCYTHIDIAASSGPFPGIPSGAPIKALTKMYLL